MTSGRTSSHRAGSRRLWRPRQRSASRGLDAASEVGAEPPFGTSAAGRPVMRPARWSTSSIGLPMPIGLAAELLAHPVEPDVGEDRAEHEHADPAERREDRVAGQGVGSTSATAMSTNRKPAVKASGSRRVASVSRTNTMSHAIRNVVSAWLGGGEAHPAVGERGDQDAEAQPERREGAEDRAHQAFADVRAPHGRATSRNRPDDNRMAGAIAAQVARGQVADEPQPERQGPGKEGGQTQRGGVPHGTPRGRRARHGAPRTWASLSTLMDGLLVESVGSRSRTGHATAISGARDRAAADQLPEGRGTDGAMCR